MTSYVTSADGTRIAFDRLGDGPALIIVTGTLCDREKTRELADRLARQFSVINYDRRGRGDSGDRQPYGVEREIEDIAALIAYAGGNASVYGHSSGAGLALRAAATGLPITQLVLHEPPYSGDDEYFKRSDTEFAEIVVAMVYDFEIMGDLHSGAEIPEDLVRSIDIPTLVIAGGASPEFFRDVATRIAYRLPNGRYTVLEGQDYGAPAEVVAPVIAEFLAGTTARRQSEVISA